MTTVTATRHLEPLVVLIPSPLLGPASWAPVAEQLANRGWGRIVSVDLRDPTDRQPCWQRTVGGVEASLRLVPDNRPVVLVAHSGAGPLLPAVAGRLRRPTAAYLFVDAGLPAGGMSRLEAIAAEGDSGKSLAAELSATLDAGRRFPEWSDADLQPIVPNAKERERLLAELRPRGREYWTEPLPIVSGWPDAPCGYLQFSTPYQRAAEQAERLGWTTRNLPGSHFHLLVEPGEVAGAVVDLLSELERAPRNASASAALKGGTP